MHHPEAAAVRPQSIPAKRCVWEEYREYVADTDEPTVEEEVVGEGMDPRRTTDTIRPYTATTPDITIGIRHFVRSFGSPMDRVRRGGDIRIIPRDEPTVPKTQEKATPR